VPASITDTTCVKVASPGAPCDIQGTRACAIVWEHPAGVMLDTEWGAAGTNGCVGRVHIEHVTEVAP
jgi:hypothetical protein